MKKRFNLIDFHALLEYSAKINYRIDQKASHEAGAAQWTRNKHFRPVRDRWTGEGCLCHGEGDNGRELRRKRI
jgi:hypothetical protein